MSKNLNKLFSPIRVVETLTTTKTLDVFDTGKVFLLNGSSGGADVTLPSPTADDITGVSYTFLLIKAESLAAWTLTLGTADLILGQVYSVAGGGADSEVTAGADVVTFVANTAVIGDKVELFFDGTSCFAHCFCNVDGGITLTG